MKYFFTILLLQFVACNIICAQDFVTRGKIEYEIKINNKKIFGPDNGDNPWRSSLPEFDISYRDLIFSWNQSIYQPGRKGAVPSNMAGDGVTYVNLDNQQVFKKFKMSEDEYILQDSLHPIRWKLENETRKIAGWECRKAVGRFDDTIYVVAFYCPEIIPQSGPELFNGLPGMILGIAIPRYYTTWFATKIEVANIDETKITPPTTKKGKVYSKKELAAILLKKYKDGGWAEATLEIVMHNLSSYTN